MFRKLTREQTDAVAIFLIWIIAGMAFNILGPSLKAGFIGGSKWQAWIPLAVALLLSLIQVVKSRVGVHMMFMVLNGIVGGVFGSRGVIDLSAVALKFSWKFLTLGLTGVLLGGVCIYLTREFLKLIPDFLTHRRQMAELNSTIAEWKEPKSPIEPEPEPKPMPPEAELAVLVSMEYRLLNPPPVEELVFPNEFPLSKLLIQAFCFCFAIRISFTNGPISERVLMASSLLGVILFGEFVYRRVMKRAAEYEPPPSTEFDEIRDKFLTSIRERRAELRRGS